MKYFPDIYDVTLSPQIYICIYKLHALLMYTRRISIHLNKYIKPINITLKIMKFKF